MHYVLCFEGNEASRSDSLDQIVDRMIEAIVLFGPNRMGPAHQMEIYDSADISVATIVAVHLSFDGTRVDRVDVKIDGTVWTYFPHAYRSIQRRKV